MGTRIISNSRSWGPASPVVQRMFDTQRAGSQSGRGHIEGGRFIEVHYDGTVGKAGCPAALPATDAWLDPQALFVIGMNMGVTFQYTGGTGTCVISGADLPRNYSSRVFDATEGPGLVTDASLKWKALGTVDATTPLQLLSVYSLIRFSFTGTAGSVTAMSR